MSHFPSAGLLDGPETTAYLLGCLKGITFCWSGTAMEPVDRLVFIRRNPGDQHNVYIR
jgi:hypothetical protein